MTTEPLNPSIATDYSKRYAENTSGIIAAIVACIVAQGGSVASYPANTGGVIKALLDLKTAISGGGGGGGGSSSGETVEIAVTAGANITAADAVYLHTDGKVYKATNSTNRAEATVLGLAKANAGVNTDATIVLKGKVTVTTGAFGASGNKFFLGAAVGSISTSPPTTSGDFVTSLGIALDNNNFVVMIEPPVELT